MLFVSLDLPSPFFNSHMLLRAIQWLREVVKFYFFEKEENGPSYKISPLSAYLQDGKYSFQNQFLSNQVVS